MYIAFEKNKLGEIESKVYYLGDDVAAAMVKLDKLNNDGDEGVWILAQIIDENSSQVYSIVKTVLDTVRSANGN